VIRGTLKSGTSAGQDVVYQLAWAGSVGGVQVLDDSSQTSIPGVSFAGGATWMKPDITGGNTLTAVTVGASSITGATPIASGSAAFEAWSQPQVSNSDSFQSSTPWNSTVLKDTNPTKAGVGVVDFHWVKGLKDPDIDAASSGAYERFTNFTQQQGPLLLVNGAVPLSQFTGNTADSAINVVLVGRNSDSGTRLGAEAETQSGFFQILEDNYYPTITAGSVTAMIDNGDAGQSSGGNIATALKTPITSGVKVGGKPFIMVGYLGKSDKNTATTGGAVELTYNGVSYTDTAVEAGQYTFWTYEHTYYLPTIGAGVQLDAINAFASQMQNTDATQSGIILTSMGTTSRQIEGGVVTH